MGRRRSRGGIPLPTDAMNTPSRSRTSFDLHPAVSSRRCGTSSVRQGWGYACATPWNSIPATDSPEELCCTHTTREGMACRCSPQASMRMICPAESGEAVRIRKPRSERSTVRALCPAGESSPSSNSLRDIFAGTRGERRSGPLKTLSMSSSVEGSWLRG